MQEYSQLYDTDACNVYLGKADKNIQSVASNFSGTVFPTENLQVGMTCVRTDDNNNMYLLTNLSPVKWELLPSTGYVDNAVGSGVKSITNFKGATSNAAGKQGLVPAPASGTQTDYYLAADGTWKKVQQRSVKEVIDIVYPVGSIWESTTSSDPNKLWPGTTWSLMDGGRVLVSSGSYSDSSGSYSYSLGATGGEAKHKLTTNELASHGHGASASTDSHTHTAWTVIGGSDFLGGHSGNNGKWGNTTTSQNSHSHSINISATGGNGYHENRPPYVVVNRWKRTA
ncbi:phage baseplate protein [uncultured Megasphaera sp.]|uniref:phage baseplate protein n=2 Tax=Megasphaera TaxID=906 RepID=UPI002062B0DE|nr:hypothetical protein [uncultured Megasphaera sp.]DAF68378.1 MAG TPA: baseplate wedge protein [Caudoviricetes sp.]